MIEKNLGNIERLLRLAAGVLFGTWSLSQPALNPMEMFVTLIALFLILNGVFGRCYLWYVLDLNSCDDNSGQIPGEARC